MARTSRTLLALTTALGTAAATIALTATSANAATTSAAACNPALVAPTGSLIGRLWRNSGGEKSVYGCPTGKEIGTASPRGSYQNFQYGKIVWSPNIGPYALVRAYVSGNKVVFRWSDTGRDWDFFNVRYSAGGRPFTQVKVARINPWSGAFSLSPGCGNGVCSTTSGHGTGTYVFHVQGCDRGTFKSDCGPWSNPVSIKVAL
ncbi:hypothetical protein GCM10010106_18040 [Thermopolyspora flexuosa]|uniref:LGFP repeat-containing protein n=1 Tax=Thermopolyspora flexuosa TaxID=103836 RepID=A0A543J451_9ACTN|nr:hypothetical protein [Thermopolyspora flexuosa]TQM77610.1 LGFP repeat-containing protein [Thermopolyspora flexuosa]GGM72112.1 hypothetical protein GCM10010106_18040 [Thermopolyspora flexuosa]